jgi:5'-methylthioadenosine phosphorylase
MIGVLGGTSFLETDVLSEGSVERVVTPYGGVEVTVNESLAMIPRHGRGEHPIPPHRINHQAHMKAFQQIGVRKVVSFGSVGSLNHNFPPGTLLVIQDFVNPNRLVTFHHDRIRFTVPVFDEAWRVRLWSALDEAGLGAMRGGIYAEVLGPRFETPSEVRALVDVADVIGMTCASETVLARELELPHAIIAMVDNYAHGIGEVLLTGDVFRERVRQNQERVLAAFQVVAGLAKEE